jgi:transposase
MIDLFVDSLSIKDYGFRTDFVENGRPAYHPSDLLKLFIYGYMNKVRFSRDLEKECRRNIEVMWLLKCLMCIINPGYSGLTIDALTRFE